MNFGSFSFCCIDFDRIAGIAVRFFALNVPWVSGTSMLRSWLASEYFKSSSRYSFLACLSYVYVALTISFTLALTASSWFYWSTSIYSVTNLNMLIYCCLSSSNSWSSSHESFSAFSGLPMWAIKSSLLTCASPSHVLMIGRTRTYSVYWPNVLYSITISASSGTTSASFYSMVSISWLRLWFAFWTVSILSCIWKIKSSCRLFLLCNSLTSRAMMPFYSIISLFSFFITSIA